MICPLIVVNTNEILASILKLGRVRRLLFTANAVFLTLAHAWEEAIEKIEELLRGRG